MDFGLNEVIVDDAAEVDFRDSDGKRFDIVRERCWRQFCSETRTPAT